MDKNKLEEMIREAMLEMTSNSEEKLVIEDESHFNGEKIGLTEKDYPLIEKRPELVKTPTDKTVDDITLEDIVEGRADAEDLKIRPETLYMQAEIAESVGRPAFANNLRRAAELIAVPDDEILEIYNALRPNRSSKEELMDIADRLESEYNCVINAELVREAARVYEARDILRRD